MIFNFFYYLSLLKEYKKLLITKYHYNVQTIIFNYYFKILQVDIDMYFKRILISCLTESFFTRKPYPFDNTPLIYIFRNRRMLHDTTYQHIIMSRHCVSTALIVLTIIYTIREMRATLCVRLAIPH
jgi:hypothetical protein